MRLHVLFIQRKESYVGEYAPEARIVWDEFSVEENPEGFEEACAKDLKEVGNDIMAHRVIPVWVDQAEIRNLLLTTPTVKGKIVAED